jgi:hypothetical protein
MAANHSFSRPRLISLAVVGVTFVGALSAHPALAQTGPGFEDGKLNKVSKHVSKLIKLAVGEKHLRLDRKHWEGDTAGKTVEQRKKAIVAKLLKRGLPEKYAISQAAREVTQPRVTQAFNELRTATSYSRAGSSSSGKSERSNYFGGRGFYGRLATSSNGLVEMELREEDGPQRRLTVRDNGKGTMRLEYSSDEHDFLLLIQQSKNGSVKMVYMVGDETLAGSAESFHALYAKHREQFDTKIFPMLRHVGVVPPLTPLSTPVVKTVLAKLVPVDGDRRRQTEQLIAQLQNDSFAKRDEATKKLFAETARHEPVIEEMLKDKDLDPETKMRLEKVIKSHRAKNLEVEQLIVSLKLTDDAKYLVGLLPDTTEQDRPNVVAALERLTGQKLGTDVSAWKKWLSKKP